VAFFSRPKGHAKAIPGTGCWFDAGNWLALLAVAVIATW